MNKVIVALVIVAGISSMVSSVAVEKWHNSHDGSLFYIDTELKYNWFAAWNECARKNMSLIAIDSSYKHQQIDALIRKLFSSCPSFWIAGHDNAIDLRYEWATTGELFTFTNWGPSQPDRLGNREHCILIWQGTWEWFDLPCDHKLGFICEENRYIKEKSHEIAELKKKYDAGANDKNKFKHFIFYINSNATYSSPISSNN
ncbi:lectin subunit alpha-like [Haematobia irritans]|uniref:lectin subunit alpha-like n=1 Tax=Haematobia irritans TaxID=7368 RepID=UPI003F4F8C64